jgi:hypothetical protein
MLGLNKQNVLPRLQAREVVKASFVCEVCLSVIVCSAGMPLAVIRSGTPKLTLRNTATRSLAMLNRNRLVGDPQARAEQVRMASTDDVLTAGARDLTVLVRCTTAAHPKKPLGVTEKLLLDRNPQVRASLALGDPTDEVIAALIEDRDEEVRAAAAAMPSLDETAVYRLVADRSDEVRRVAIATHATRVCLAPSDILWLKEDRPCVDSLLKLPPRSRWERLIMDEDTDLALRVVLLVLTRPVKVLWQVGLDVDSPPELLHAVVQHPRCPKTLADDVLRDLEVTL